MQNSYCIKRFYRARTRYHHHDDSLLDDQWQLEVYLHALGLMKKHGLESVIDIGCGSAYKLLTYLGDYETTGIEVPANVEALRRRFPDKRWEVSDFSVKPDIRADLVICADVLEHLVDPDELLHYIKNIEYKYLVLSTPDRALRYKPWQRGHFGPPANRTHVREWSFREFHEYISLHFHIVDHRVTNPSQCTQMVVCTPRETGR